MVVPVVAAEVAAAGGAVATESAAMVAGGAACGGGACGGGRPAGCCREQLPHLGVPPDIGADGGCHNSEAELGFEPGADEQAGEIPAAGGARAPRRAHRPLRSLAGWGGRKRRYRVHAGRGHGREPCCARRACPRQGLQAGHGCCCTLPAPKPVRWWQRFPLMGGGWAVLRGGERWAGGRCGWPW